MSLSSAEAEYRAMVNGVKEALWIQGILEEKLYCQDSIKFFCTWSKHMRISSHFVKEKIEAGIIQTTFVSSTTQTADIFTKGLAGPLFQRHVSGWSPHILYLKLSHVNRSSPLSFCLNPSHYLHTGGDKLFCWR